MNNPKNHHFVPQVYLKEFSNSQKLLFQSLKGQENISIKSIAQVCYEPYYFRIHSKDNLFLRKIKDQDHIEKNVFKKQENLYPKLLKKIKSPSLTYSLLNKSEVAFFLGTLITIKRRNPTYRDQVIQHFKEHVASEQFKKEAAKGFEISRRIDKIDPVEFFENYVKEATTNKDKQSDIYLEGFVDNENKTIQNSAQLLMRYKVFVYFAPFGSEFITSDNPGFTVLPDGQLYSFGGFGFPFTFIFPLTPKCCLYISHLQIEEDPLNLKKVIYPVYTYKSFVDSVNEGTYKLAIEKVFSYSKSSLIK